jgi:hypothetical protein
VLPVKLYYDYRLPHDASPCDYEGYINNLDSMIYFKESDTDFVMPALAVDLDDREKKELLSYIVARKPKYKIIWRDNIAKIKELNPELQSIPLKDSYEECEFLRGAANGFAPKDIDYWLGRREFSKAVEAEYNKFMQTVFNAFGFFPGFWLSPEHQKIVAHAVHTYGKSKQYVPVQGR